MAVCAQPEPSVRLLALDVAKAHEWRPRHFSSVTNGGCERGFENFHALIKH